MKTLTFLFVLTASCASLCPAMAQTEEIQKDTVPSTKEVKNRNVMLNASNDDRPREISIGLPASTATIFVNGLLESYYNWPCYPYNSWKGGSGYGRTSLMSLGETSLRSGNVTYAVNSMSKEGSDTFEGALNYTLNHFGKQTIDLNISGPIKKGWSYTIGSYQNFDPGSNKNDYADNQDRTQIYTFGLTKRWNEDKGKFSLFYKYHKNNALRDNIGPFIYNGDGSVTPYEDFDLGTDSYMPTNGILQYRDVKTGELVTTTMKDGNEESGHQVYFLFDYAFNNGMQLAIRSKFKHADAVITNRMGSGIDEVTADQGYTYEDGTSYSGLVQNRYVMHYEGFAKDWLTNVELTKKSGAHSWRIGLDECLNYASIATSTANMAHEVKVNPKMLLLNNDYYWTFNTGAEYYDGHENKLALYASDDWDVTSRWWLSGGLRLEYYNVGGDAAMNIDGQTNNSRVEDFNLKADGVTITPFKKNYFTMAATLNTRYTLFKGFGLIGEYVFNRQRPRLENFAGADYPVLDPVDIQLARAGVFYNNKWLQLVSQFFYVSQSNNKSRSTFSKQVNGLTENVTEAINYNIETLGWTTDVVLKPFQGFNFHGLFTIQSPKYKDFIINPVFSDGTNEYHNFNGKTVTSISNIIAELNPSYTWKDWRVWASLRYQSKQYINKTNSMYFNGRWETFAGVDYRLNKHVMLSGNVINFLNQKGASGSISSADLLEDASGYRNYLMAGDYIRPFTVEFSAHINF